MNERPLDLRLGAWNLRVILRKEEGAERVEVDGVSMVLRDAGRRDGRWLLEIEGQRIPVRFLRQGDTVWVQTGGRIYPVRMRVPTEAAQENQRRDPLIRSPMTGKVIRVPVRPGDRVEEGEVVVTVEAMKMEYHLEAPFDAVVEEVHAREGDLVDQDQVLVRLRPVKEAHEATD